MPKNPKGKSKAVKRDDPMNNVMKFFLAGCVAELYLLIVRRYYVNGYAEQQIAWYDVYLKTLILAGVAILVLGAVLTALWKSNRKKCILGLAIVGAGAFLAVSSFLVRWNMSTLSLLIVLVPVLMLLVVLWGLYDHECALALTVLGTSLIVMWICRRTLTSVYLSKFAMGAAVLYMVLLIAIALLTKSGKLSHLLPGKAAHTPVYVACGLSVIAIAVALINSSAAYYAMLALAAVVFGLAVYYTVKQL